MTRHDQNRFDFGAKGDIGEFIKLDGNAKIDVELETRIAFSRSGKDRVAFAYKAARLLLNKGRWELLPGRVMLGDENEAFPGFVPQPGRLSKAMDSPDGF